MVQPIFTLTLNLTWALSCHFISLWVFNKDKIRVTELGSFCEVKLYWITVVSHTIMSRQLLSTNAPQSINCWNFRLTVGIISFWQEQQKDSWLASTVDFGCLTLLLLIIYRLTHNAIRDLPFYMRWRGGGLAEFTIR